MSWKRLVNMGTNCSSPSLHLPPPPAFCSWASCSRAFVVVKNRNVDSPHIYPAEHLKKEVRTKDTRMTILTTRERAPSRVDTRASRHEWVVVYSYTYSGMA
ncbi:hypothetical protein AG1IA_01930 [Rhizoctonia solani AG-1 IA]|uniref:Uncharacterized protein n=1 Tax=Thanatephorus cucumeris (strain AG1-IA) TaxID=983506 RepID=L8X4S8_THACA|nr:hypothetical protein AG1IA_01930 [Rhizoctonia solani AG-1 IA]